MSEQAKTPQKSGFDTGLRSIISGKVFAVASIVTLPFDITEKVFGATSGLLLLSAGVFVVLLLVRKTLLKLAPGVRDTVNAAIGVFGVLTLLSGGCYFYNNAVGPARAKGVLLDKIPGLEQALDPVLVSLSRLEKAAADILRTTHSIDDKTDELLRNAMPEVYEKPKEVIEEVSYFEVFGQGIGTEAAGHRQWALRIGPNERFGRGSLSVVMSGDFNNDGYIDALIHYWDGGNMSDGYIDGFLLHKGGAHFRYVPIELDDVSSVKDATVVDGGSALTAFELTTVDGGIVRMHFRGDSVQVTQQAEMAKAFGLATLFSNDVLQSRDFRNENSDRQDVGRLSFDYNADGMEDEMICGYWKRHNVLQGCSVHLQGEVVEIGEGSPLNLQCRSIVVSDVFENGFHRLICEYNDIRDSYSYDPVKVRFIKLENG